VGFLNVEDDISKNECCLLKSGDWLFHILLIVCIK